MTYLPDVNVWIALSAERHVHHDIARSWFGSLRGQGVAFCRVTQLGFLRLLTNRHVMQEEVMNPESAWRAYRAIRMAQRVGYLREPVELAEDWAAFAPLHPGSPNLWTDAYLCAFSHFSKLTLVTFDARMQVRPDARCVVLGPQPGQ